MRQGQQSKRSRGGRSSNRRPGNSNTKVYDSSGPSGKIRGSAGQLYDKYQALARDAWGSGSYVDAENYLQHAEHYYRVQTRNDEQNKAASQRDHNAHNNGAGNGASNSENEPSEAVSKSPDAALNGAEVAAAAKPEALPGKIAVNESADGAALKPEAANPNSPQADSAEGTPDPAGAGASSEIGVPDKGHD